MSRFGVGIRYTLNRSVKKQGMETMWWREVWLLWQCDVNLYTCLQPAERVTVFLDDTDTHCEILFSPSVGKAVNVVLIIKSFSHSSTSCGLCPVCVCMRACVCVHACMRECAQLCLTLWDPMDYSPPGSLSTGFPGQEYLLGKISKNTSWARFPSPCILWVVD